MGKTSDYSVEHTGAVAGDVLIGYRNHNLALVIRLTEDLPEEGRIGRIAVPFNVLHAGCGTHRDVFRQFEGQPDPITREEIVRNSQVDPRFMALNANSFFNASFQNCEERESKKMKRAK